MIVVRILSQGIIISAIPVYAPECGLDNSEKDKIVWWHCSVIIYENQC